MIRVGILGATGYTALELIKILFRHPDVEITAVTSRQEGSPHIAAIHPQLTDRLDLELEDSSPETVAAKADARLRSPPDTAESKPDAQLVLPPPTAA